MIAWSSGLGEKLYKGVSAAMVYDEITAIGDSATPEQIVDAARDESSELHKCFTWNDTEAAEKWRKQEARRIRHFLVVRNEEKPDLPPVRAFQFVRNSEGYKPTEQVFQRPDEYALMLKRAYAELRAFEIRNKILESDLSEVFAAIDALPE